ncbi:alpha/beta hydrolase [Nonlabens marinus]|uniref:Hydrolase n=1 Tax=Nonlabens marinus S1-08 TaxID=1454201 RepID=W8W013_9FLAO|nr:alpha/beta hydrolase [Nonlabens marinus]BAO55526.1 hydrolase [Nonlabens marinus S1-08]
MIKKMINKAVPKLYGFYFNTISIFSKKRGAEKALQVFSFPRKGKVLEFQKEFLETAHQQKLVTEEGMIQLYYWEGTGKTVFMAHGWESNAWRWKYLIDPLRELGYSIIALDAPAHGKSDGTNFTAVKYSRVIRTVVELYQPEIIIGHSVGAMASSFQESETPHVFVEKMVLLGSPNKLEVIMRDYQNLVRFTNSVYLSLDKLLHSIYGFYIHEFNTEDFISKIKCPILLVHSKEDRIVPHTSMEQIAANSSNSTVYFSKTGGHSLHTEEVVEQILSFL